MRTLSLVGLLALAGLSLPAAAQTAAASPRSTFVVPSHPGETVRVTTYARRPVQRGRLARRYAGVRVNRSVQRQVTVVPAQPVNRVYTTPNAAFIKRHGSYFPVTRAR